MNTLESPPSDPGNVVIANTLHWLSVLQEIDEAGTERIAAWRHAASTVRHLEQPVTELLEVSGPRGLEQLGIAPGIAAMVADWIRTGELPVLETSKRRQHGLWPALARALCKSLGIESGERQPSRALANPALRKPLGAGHRPVWESWN